MDKHAVVEFGEFSTECQVGHEPASSTPEPTVKSSQCFVGGAADAPCDHAKDSTGSIAGTFLISSSLAALASARRQAQPRSEVFFAFPVGSQIRAGLGHQLEEGVIAD